MKIVKIPASAVEMPDDPVTTTLDVQFGGMDLSSESSLSFSSVMQGGKSSGMDGGLMYGAGSKLDGFATGANSEKDLKSSGVSQSSFQAPVNAQSQAALTEATKSTGATSMNPGMDSLTSLSQNQAKSQQPGSNYGNSGGSSGSAFVSYAGKPAPGFPAPGFPPVTQAATGVYGNSNSSSTGGIPQSYGSQQSGYIGNLSYGNQQVNPSNQPLVASSQSTNVPYGPTSGPPSNTYHNMNSGVGSG